MPVSDRLPDDAALCTVLRFCDEPTRDVTVRLSREMAAMTRLARQQDYQAAARRPGRLSTEPLPLASELAERGCWQPHWRNIFATLGPPAARQRGPSPLSGFYRHAAALQEGQRLDFVTVHKFSGGSWAGRLNGQKLPEGFGRFVDSAADGAVTLGFFRAGRPQGYAVCGCANHWITEGFWQAGRHHGAGAVFDLRPYLCREPAPVPKAPANEGLYRVFNRLEGTFVDNQLHGEGSQEQWFWYSDARRGLHAYYRGSFSRGCWQGQGQASYGDGARLTGTFMGGQLHGQGRFVGPDGSGYAGEFVGGHFAGAGAFFTAAGIFATVGQGGPQTGLPAAASAEELRQTRAPRSAPGRAAAGVGAAMAHRPCRVALA